VNSAPSFLMVPILVGGFMGVRELRAHLLNGDSALVRRWAIAAGLLLAACTSLRLQNVPVAGLTIVGGVLLIGGVPWIARVAALGWAAAASVLGLLGWSLSLWVSSGTPLIPFLPGNYVAIPPPAQDPDGVSSAVDRLLGYLGTGEIVPYSAALLVALVLAYAVRPMVGDATLMYVVVAAAAMNYLVMTELLPLASNELFGRYIFPVPAAIAVLLLLEAVTAHDRSTRTMSGPSVPLVTSLAAVAPLVTAFLVLLFVFAPSEGYVRYAVSMERSIGDLASDGHNPQTEAWIGSQSERAQYAAVQRMLTGSARVIVAVDRPYLLTGDQRDAPSLGIVGAAAPDGEFPVFGSTLAKVQRLRAEGYDQLVVTAPSQDACSPPRVVAQSLRPASPASWQLIATYIKAWQDSVAEIMRRAPEAVHREGSLLVVDLPRAETALG
jgi:hypothetical protein